MNRLPVLRAEAVIRALEKAGFQIIRQRGSHVRLGHADRREVTVPVHSGQVLGRGILRKILRDAEITLEDFARILRE